MIIYDGMMYNNNNNNSLIKHNNNDNLWVSVHERRKGTVTYPSPTLTSGV